MEIDNRQSDGFAARLGGYLSLLIIGFCVGVVLSGWSETAEMRQCRSEVKFLDRALETREQIGMVDVDGDGLCDGRDRAIKLAEWKASSK